MYIGRALSGHLIRVLDFQELKTGGNKTILRKLTFVPNFYKKCYAELFDSRKGMYLFYLMFYMYIQPEVFLTFYEETIVHAAGN